MISIAAEKNFENRVKKFLESEGCWFVKFFANAYTKAGIPDLLVCCNSYFLGVELKAPRGKPSELQKWNVNKITEANGIGVVLYPDQFERFQHMIKFLNDGQEIEAWKIAAEINERWVR